MLLFKISIPKYKTKLFCTLTSKIRNVFCCNFHHYVLFSGRICQRVLSIQYLFMMFSSARGPRSRRGWVWPCSPRSRWFATTSWRTYRSVTTNKLTCFMMLQNLYYLSSSLPITRIWPSALKLGIIMSSWKKIKYFHSAEPKPPDNGRRCWS